LKYLVILSISAADELPAVERKAIAASPQAPSNRDLPLDSRTWKADRNPLPPAVKAFSLSDPSEIAAT
jgi:hypothetical protein